MTIEKHATITETHDIDIMEVTLLSLEEARETDTDLLCMGELWWLCSPGYNAFLACGVYDDGFLSDDCYVSNSYGGVRPALRFKSDNITKGDVFTCAGFDFTAISYNLALCNSIVGNTCFRENCVVAGANDYETSDVKKWLDKWAVENGLKEKTG